jgi:hypothetical protein
MCLSFHVKWLLRRPMRVKTVIAPQVFVEFCSIKSDVNPPATIELHHVYRPTDGRSD